MNPQVLYSHIHYMNELTSFKLSVLEFMSLFGCYIETAVLNVLRILLVYISSVQLYKEENPLLMKDPCAVLLELVLSMPHTIDKGK